MNAGGHSTNRKLKDLTRLNQGPLAQVLNGDGEETRLVGGAVRDLVSARRAGG